MLALASELPSLRLLDLGYLVEVQGARLERSAVTARLCEPATGSVLDEVSPDAVVWAAGSRGNTSSVSAPESASHPDMVDVAAFLAGRSVGERVVVDGRGEGAEIAVSLARSGHDVCLVERSHRFQPLPYGYALRRVEALGDYMKDEAVPVRWSSEVVGVDDGVVLVKARNGVVSSVPADTLLVAGRGPVPAGEEVELDRSVTLVEIGDARAPRGVAEALAEARTAATMIAG